MVSHGVRFSSFDDIALLQTGKPAIKAATTLVNLLRLDALPRTIDVRRLTCKQMAGRIRRLGVIILLTIALSSCGVFGRTTTNAQLAAPDLTLLIANLTSSDPATQETALVPALRANSEEPKGIILPPGSTLAIIPGTWEVSGTDRTGQPYLGKIQATLTRPGQPPTAVSLHLIDTGTQWLLYETSSA